MRALRGMGAAANGAAAAAAAAAQAAQLPVNDLLWWYVANQTLTASGNGTQLITILNDADFEWRWIIGNSTGGYTLILTNDFNNEPLMPSGINNVNCVGTAQLPFILPRPYLLKRTATISCAFTDTSAAPNTVQLCLVGYKLFGSSS